MLIRVFLAAFLLFIHGAHAAEQGQLDASPSVFTVMAAINAAGFDADLESGANHPLRELIRKHLAAVNAPVLAELKGFYARHKQKDPTADLSQYISFALSVDGPPNFAYRFKAQEIPPDVVPLDGLEKLMARFYREANIEDLWKKSRPAIDAALVRYHGPVIQAVQLVNAYLRYSTSGYLGRRFQIYIDLLGPPNQIQSRSYMDDFFIVLTPSPEPMVFDVRHAYLHYLLDPLATKYSEELMKKQPLGDYALGAPALEDYYKNDFLLLATESLIKAVEARLDQKPGAVEQALREGFVLAPHFYEQLLVYEKQERIMRLYYPDLVTSISFKKEEKRLDNVQFVQQKPVRLAKVVPAERKVELTGAFKNSRGSRAVLHREGLREGQAGLSPRAGRILRQAAPRQVLLRAGADRGRRKGPRTVGKAVPEGAGFDSGPANRGLGARLPGPVGRLGGGA